MFDLPNLDPVTAVLDLHPLELLDLVTAVLDLDPLDVLDLPGLLDLGRLDLLMVLFLFLLTNTYCKSLRIKASAELP